MPIYRTAFISHAHADNARCLGIANRLKARGVDVWIDLSNLQVGHALSAEITRELVERQAFVLLMTPTANTSPWVGNELDTYLAYRLDRTMQIVNGQQRLIVPVRLEPVTIQQGPRVSNWAKVFSLGWIDGVGKSDDVVADEIAAALLVSNQPIPSPKSDAQTTPHNNAPSSSQPSLNPQHADPVSSLLAFVREQDKSTNRRIVHFLIDLFGMSFYGLSFLLISTIVGLITPSQGGALGGLAVGASLDFILLFCAIPVLIFYKGYHKGNFDGIYRKWDDNSAAIAIIQWIFVLPWMMIVALIAKIRRR